MRPILFFLNAIMMNVKYPIKNAEWLYAAYFQSILSFN
ncbi:uncharacterized protein Dvar_16440 [Desulfosarcina variabilis str. Montpellier]